MALLKEDGSLDIEYIKNLPIEECREVVGSLTKEQFEEYYASIPLNESQEHTKAIKTDKSIEDMLNQGCERFDVLINNLIQNEKG